VARPRKHRKVSYSPDVVYFKPAGVPLSNLEELSLLHEELEALRLQNIELLNQETASKLMHISQSTFNRIILNARKKVTEALIYGKAIRIQKK
jgi:predicted DNA-binding protein (UPF0251 family)